MKIIMKIMAVVGLAGMLGAVMADAVCNHHHVGATQSCVFTHGFHGGSSTLPCQIPTATTKAIATYECHYLTYAPYCAKNHQHCIHQNYYVWKIRSVTDHGKTFTFDSDGQAG